MSDMRRCV